MQFIEKNSFNVRSAVYHLKKQNDGLEFILFPMIHVASKEFYSEVSQRLASCDMILVEGVSSRKVQLLTLSYRIVKRIRRMALVTQHDGLNVSGLRRKIIKADIEGSDFDRHWSTLPIVFRAQLLFLLPFYVIWLFLFGTRETIAKEIALDDLPSSKEVLYRSDDIDKMNAVLLDKRDQKLIQHIERLRFANGSAKKTVGILYGAMHMRNVSNFLLDDLKYSIEKAEWVKVFDLL